MALTPSHRITVIREIAQRLKKDDWSLIDLTLRQFGLPVTETWHGEKSDYVIEMIQGGQAADLIELARHLGFQLQKTSTSPDPSFWKDGMLRLFISHLAKHRSFAAQLQGSLIDFGICGFVAHSDIEPTEEWQTAIETALVTCDALVTLLHPEFHRSNWTDQEIGFAMGRGLPVFSVRLGQDPYGFIGRFQAFDGKNNTADVLAAELFVAYRKNKQTQGKMADSLVRLFEESHSFATAKERIGYLEELEFWESSFSERISAAVKKNSQISDSFGVPSRIRALGARWAKKGIGS